MTSVNILISLACLSTLGLTGTSNLNDRMSFLRNALIASESVVPQADQNPQPQIYRHTTPAFSFSIPSGWEEYSKTPTPGVYTKLWRVVDGVFTGSGIRFTGGPAGGITEVWNISPNDLRAGFEKEYVIRNYRTDRVTVNGKKAMRFEFDSQLAEGGKIIPIKIVGHAFLSEEPEGDYLIMALLLSRVFEIRADNAGYMTVVNSLSLR